MPKIDIDALARDAQREIAKSNSVDPWDSRENLPIRAWFWNVLVEPLKPKERSKGGIIVTEQAQEAKKLTTTIGIIRDIGPTAFTGKTSSGIDLSRFSREIEYPEDLIGRFVSYQRYTGHAYEMRNGRRLIMITESEILGEVPDPDQFVFYYD